MGKKKGADIKADLLEERRQWILDYRQDPSKLKFPAEFDEFYNRFDTQEAEEDPKGKGDKGKDKGKDAKADKGKGKDKGKGGKGKEQEEEVVEVGPSAVVQQF